MILVIPLVAVIALAGLRLVDSSQRAVSAGLFQSLAEVSAETSRLMHELHRERIVGARMAADQEEDTSRFNLRATETDQAVAAYRAARERVTNAPDLVEERLRRIDNQIDSLGPIRQEILGDAGVTVSAVMLRYGVIVDDVIAFQESVGQVTDDPELAESVRAVAALSKAKVHMATAQAAAFTAFAADSPDEERLTAFLATQTGVQESLLAFSLAATPSQQATLDATLTGDAVVLAERAASAVVRSSDGQQRISAEAASNALGSIVNLVRFAEQRLHDEQVLLASQSRDAVRQQVLIESTAALLVLAIAIVVTVFLARMLAKSLGQLREGALTVANKDLPETVARFSDPRNLGEHTPAEVAAQVRDPIQLRSRDEVGQVAQAFNVVHQAAVRVAAEQAALRTSVSAMFLNLARRSQTLVDRMINQLDEIERNEEDPKRLSRLFSLDHLATRMRRNDENLLVLAGADSGPPRTDDAAIPDVLRASQSEVEHYDRIEFGTVDADVSVAAPAVNDVVRLVAELFDNATRFSPPSAPVVAEARRLGDQLIIQVEDRGVGMSKEQASQLNSWLAAPPEMELTTFRRMGLAVVGRLAARHGIRVELHSSPQSGTVAYAALPPTALVLPPYRSRQFELPEPRTPMPAEQIEQPPPPVPARHLNNQLPQRPADVASHVARRRALRDGVVEAAPEPSHFNESASNPAISRAEANQPPAQQPSMQQPTGAHPTAGANHPTAPQPTVSHDPSSQSSYNQPVAGRPPEGMVRRTVNLPPPDQTVEIPIFQEVEAVWFRSHGQLDLGARAEAAGRTANTAPPAASAPPATPTHAEPNGGATGDWRTAADDGWNAAQVASEPPTGGATRSGLPKRVPQAQLVPGGVEGPGEGSATSQRRSPDEVRGLLAAYHRGVQRGREHWGR